MTEAIATALRRVVCLFRGHMWDWDWRGGAFHLRDFCWRCHEIRIHPERSSK